jgi:hypothetical protein
MGRTRCLSRYCPITDVRSYLAICTHTHEAEDGGCGGGDMTVAHMSAHVNKRGQQCAVVSKVIMLMLMKAVIFRAQNPDTVCHVCHADTHANACPSTRTRARTHVGGLSQSAREQGWMRDSWLPACLCALWRK